MRCVAAIVVVALTWGRPCGVTAQSEPEPAAAATETTQPVLWPWALVGIGGAMFVAAAVTGGLTLERQAALDRVCSAHSCPPAAEASQAEGRALAFSTDALWVGGLVVLAAGVVLVLTLPGEPVAASAACGPDGCTLTVRGAF